MNTWMSKWVCGQMDEWISDGLMDKNNRYMSEQINGWISGWVNEYVVEWIDRWMDEWTK